MSGVAPTGAVEGRLSICGGTGVVLVSSPVIRMTSWSVNAYVAGNHRVGVDGTSTTPRQPRAPGAAVLAAARLSPRVRPEFRSPLRPWRLARN